MIFHCPYCGIKVAPSAQTCPTCTRKMIRDCPACAESIAANASLCKYCGEEVKVEKSKAPLRVAPPRPSPDIEFIDEPAPLKIAWEDPRKGVFRRWWGTFFQTSFRPGSVFKDMKLTGHRWPVGYSYGFIAQGLVVALFVMLAVGGVTLAVGEEISTDTAWTSVGIFTAAIPISFIAVTLALYLGAFLWHIPVFLFGGKGGYQSTLRIVGYSTGVNLWSFVIPYAGAVMTFVMQTLLLYHGFRNLHQMSKTRAILCIVFPYALMILAVAGLVTLVLTCGCDGAPPGEAIMQEPF